MLNEPNATMRFIANLSSSMSISLIWVANYRYQYNFDVLNSGGLNWWAFACWSVAGLAVLNFDALIRKIMFRAAARLFVVWLTYLTVLLLVEYASYHVIGIHEVGGTDHTPLVFDLVHGSKNLHVFYLIYPLVLIATYDAVVRVLRLAQRLRRA